MVKFRLSSILHFAFCILHLNREVVMLCQNCKQKKATYHSLKNINGNVTEQYLCNDCRRLLHDSMGMNEFPQNIANISNIGIVGSLDGFADFFGMLSGMVENKPQSTLTCNNCGTTFDEFKKSLYVGCQQCYKNFEPNLQPMINSLQHATSHTGRVPKGMEHMQEYHDLEMLIAKAKSEERFEDAISLRDTLKKLKSEHQNG